MRVLTGLAFNMVSILEVNWGFWGLHMSVLVRSYMQYLKL